MYTTSSRQKFLVICIVMTVIAILSGVFVLRAAAAAETPILYLFWGDGCSYCEKEKEFLKGLHQRYPEVEMRFFETWNHPEFSELAKILRQAYSVESSSVPLTFIGDWTITGFGSPETTGMQLEEQVIACIQKGCTDAIKNIGPRRITARIKAEASSNNPVDWERFPAAAGTAR